MLGPHPPVFVPFLPEGQFDELAVAGEYEGRTMRWVGQHFQFDPTPGLRAPVVLAERLHGVFKRRLGRDRGFWKRLPPTGLENVRLRGAVEQGGACLFCGEGIGEGLELRLGWRKFKVPAQAGYFAPLNFVWPVHGNALTLDLVIRGKGSSGYTCTTVLWHNMVAHGYLPPQEFIDAVMRPQPWWWRLLEITRTTRFTPWDL